jgi:hypothetical protein
MAVLLLVSPPHTALLAQGLENEQAIDTIVGSDVTTNEENAEAEQGRIVAAIEKTAANTGEVRKKFSLDKVEIIFLPDLAENGTDLDAKLAEYEDQIVELREAIEGSAMFYHAVDSRDVLLRDVVALEFDDKNGVTIFVAGEDPAD